jgi:TonB family protein
MLRLRLFLVLAFLTAITADGVAAQPAATAVWQDGHNSALSDEQLLHYAVTSPPVPFPEEAQKSNLTGSGLYELSVDKSGRTTAVAVVKSSRSKVLDQTAVATFRRWRFKPGVFTRVRVPVSWSVNRVR